MTNPLDPLNSSLAWSILFAARAQQQLLHKHVHWSFCNGASTSTIFSQYACVRTYHWCWFPWYRLCSDLCLMACRGRHSRSIWRKIGSTATLRLQSFSCRCPRFLNTLRFPCSSHRWWKRSSTFRCRLCSIILPLAWRLACPQPRSVAWSMVTCHHWRYLVMVKVSLVRYVRWIVGGHCLWMVLCPWKRTQKHVCFGVQCDIVGGVPLWQRGGISTIGNSKFDATHSWPSKLRISSFHALCLFNTCHHPWIRLWTTTTILHWYEEESINTNVYSTL